MDARAHLDSYRESLKKDALEGCIEYSKIVKTAKPDQYPTVYHYLKYTLDAAKYHAEADDPKSYQLWLPKHQEAMILLFERMVSEFLFESEDPPLDLLLQMIEEKGPAWFKFGQQMITYKFRLADSTRIELRVVPRPIARWAMLPIGPPTLDVDEVESILALQDGDMARAIVDYRSKHPNMKFMGMQLLDREPRVEYRELRKVNGERVGDWSLPLFGGVQ